MKHIQSITGDLDVCVTEDGQLAIMAEDAEGYGHVIEVPDMDRLIAELRRADLIAAEVRAQVAERTHGGRCQVNLLHRDKSESRCVLPKRHLLDDSDHQDEHGHHAPVLVSQSTIREVQALQDARDAELTGAERRYHGMEA